MVIRLPALPSIPTMMPGSLAFPLVATAGLAGALVVLARRISGRICYIGKDEQLLLKNLTDKRCINGPAVYFPSYFNTLSFKKRKGSHLSALQYAVVEDEQTGERRVVPGPCLLFLGPYESLVAPAERSKTVLGPKEALTVLNSTTGEERLVKGPTTFVPGPLEQVVNVVEPITLNQNQYVRLQDKLTGQVWIEKGPALLFLEPQWKSLGGDMSSTAYALKSHQFIRLQDSLTGTVRVERGEKLVFPTAFEAPLDNPPIQEAMDLKAWEYVVVQDRTSGKVRVERGEKLVWLGPNEKFGKEGKQQAHKVDAERAVLVRNLGTGALYLVEKPQLFFPKEDEEVVEVRSRIKLADNEAVVLKDGEGKYHYRYGDSKKDGGEGERSFFLPPYWEQVTQFWSRGRRRERKDLPITVFDMRAQYMSFEFNCRTSDNVEMVLEGTFFWEVVDLPAMIKFTGDASGDTCAHARSCFIQLVSKVTLQTFMDTFNDIARAAHSTDDTFYSQRGLKIHSLEVTRYQCADASTSAILEAIIQETTNRMNRLNCQESENEVALAKLRGVVEQERANSEVLAIRQEHGLASARAEGAAESERCLAFLKGIQEAGWDGEFAKVQGLAVGLWHELRRGEAIEKVASGNATVYFTPQDANLTIENRARAY